MTASCDVAVVGAGPAGAATALALRRRGVARVVLVEAGRHDRVRVGESVPPDLRVPLGRLGLWDAFLAEGHEPCHGSCAAWGDDQLRFNDFVFNPHGAGYHLDRARFDRWLARAACAAGVELWTAARVMTVERVTSGVALQIALGGTATATALAARFVVDATGPGARVSRRLGAPRRIDDRMTFIYGFFPPGSATGDSSLTVLEAVPYGWWYAARLAGGRIAAALASDPASIRGGQLHRPAIWRARLARTRYVGGLLAPDAAVAGPLIVCDAPSACLGRSAGPDWLAVGDAAAAFDPLSSQGIHKALGDGLRAGDAIAAELSGAGPGALDDYAAFAARRFDHYLRDRAEFYAGEPRWADAPFWARRRGAQRAVRESGIAASAAR